MTTAAERAAVWVGQEKLWSEARPRREALCVTLNKKPVPCHLPSTEQAGALTGPLDRSHERHVCGSADLVTLSGPESDGSVRLRVSESIPLLD